MTRSTISRAVALLAALLLLAAACGDDAEETAQDPAQSPTTAADGDDGSESGEDLASLVSAAKAEGSVSCFLAAQDTLIDRVAERFEAEYGIDVNCERVNGGPQVERITQEVDAGRLSVDVAIGTDLLFMDQLAEDGHLADVSTLPAAEEAQEEFPEDAWNDHRPLVALSAISFVYNTDLVSEDELPETYQELLDPRWRGRLATVAPSAGLGSVMYYLNILELEGEEYFEAFGEQDVAVFETSSEPTQLTISGAKDANLFGSGYAAFTGQQEGAPIENYLSLDRVTVFGYGMTTFLEGPNPNAGKLLANWLMTEDGQCALACEQTLTPSHPDVTDGLPLPENYKIFDAQYATDERDRINALFDQHVR